MNKKHETYCDYNLTNLLTKLGFDWKDYFVAHNINEHFHWEIPLHIAQKWLREVKGYSIYPTRGGYKIYVLDINDSAGFSKTYELNSNLTYEESQEYGIKKALELILEKGE